jgi:predicted RNA binding protein YcfA (HicA-like mRNA interferase family)
MKRQTGSHMISGNGKGLRIVIPNHSKKSLHPKIVKDTLEIVKNSIKSN